MPTAVRMTDRFGAMGRGALFRTKREGPDETAGSSDNDWLDVGGGDWIGLGSD